MKTFFKFPIEKSAKKSAQKKNTLKFQTAAWIRTCGTIKLGPWRVKLHTTTPRHRVLDCTEYLRVILNGGCC